MTSREYMFGEDRIYEVITGDEDLFPGKGFGLVIKEADTKKLGELAKNVSEEHKDEEVHEVIEVIPFHDLSDLELVERALQNIQYAMEINERMKEKETL